MKDERRRTRSQFFILPRSSFILRFRPRGGTETTRACEARSPGSIPGGGMTDRRAARLVKRHRASVVRTSHWFNSSAGLCGCRRPEGKRRPPPRKCKGLARHPVTVLERVRVPYEAISCI